MEKAVVASPPERINAIFGPPQSGSLQDPPDSIRSARIALAAPERWEKPIVGRFQLAESLNDYVTPISMCHYVLLQCQRIAMLCLAFSIG
jgi:hypothetical protein